MVMLLAGLVLFFLNHSIRILAPAWRERFITSYGKNTWRLSYSVFSLIGLALIIYGYGMSRATSALVWVPPLWTRHLAITFTWLAFILLAAASVPANHIKQKLGHPMYAGIKIWAFAHLIANGRLSEVILFGAFLLWAVLGFATARRRDRAEGITYPAGTMKGTMTTLLAGTAVWFVFAWWLHFLLIGVQPFA